MRPFDIFRKKPVIKGEIGYFGLSEWWLSEFTELEKKHIQATYSPIGSGAEILLNLNIVDSSVSVINFLHNLSGWFNNKEDRYLCIRILSKAEELITNETDIMDFHFFLQHMIKFHYSNRLVDPKSSDKAIESCWKQIEIAPKVAKVFKQEFEDGFFPSHLGYTQLAIIKKKENKFQEVIDICTKAKNEGWSGDWELRIEFCNKKLAQK